MKKIIFFPVDEIAILDSIDIQGEIYMWKKDRQIYQLFLHKEPIEGIHMGVVIEPHKQNNKNENNTIFWGNSKYDVLIKIAKHYNVKIPVYEGDFQTVLGDFIHGTQDEFAKLNHFLEMLKKTNF